MRFASCFVFLCGSLVFALQPSCSATIPSSTASSDAGTDGTAEAAVCTPAPEFRDVKTFVFDFHSEPPRSGKDCWIRHVVATVDFTAGQFGSVHVESCKTEGMTTDFDGPLTEVQANEIRKRISAFCETPLPSQCSMDGLQYQLTFGSAPSSSTFLFDDYNCHGRKDVRYASGDVEGLLAELAP